MSEEEVSSPRPFYVYLIIGVVLFLILGMGVNLYAKNMGETGKLAECSLSVAKVHQTAKGTTVLGTQAASCPIIYKEYELRGDEEEAKTQLTNLLLEQMKSCWSKFGKGQKAPYSGELIDREAHCFTCTTFSFEADANILHNVDDMLIEAIETNPLHKRALEDAVWSQRNKVYLGISDLDEESGEPDESSSSYGFQDVVPWHMNLQEGKNYNVEAVFIVDRDALHAGLNTQAVLSRLFFIESEDRKNVCAQVNN